MKILTTKVRPNNLAGYFREYMKDDHDIIPMPEHLDIRGDIEHWFNQHRDADAFINMAGVTDMHSIEDWTYDRALKVISVNLAGAIHATAMFVRATRGQKKSLKHIIHVGSLWSRKCATGGAAYAASKAGLAHYVSCAGYELPKDYSVIGIHPPNIAGTGMTQQVKDNLKRVRGMSEETITEIYKDALEPEYVVKEIVLALMHGRSLSGENIYLGCGDHR